MKTLLFASALISALAASMTSVAAMADTAEQMATQAQSAFANRDYNNSGIQAAQLSADLYMKAAAAAPDKSTLKAQYLVNASASLDFVGEASTDNATKITVFQKGTTAADDAVKILGIPDVPSAQPSAINALKASLAGKPELALLGDALYFRGINVGQWGEANGVISSLSRWPELRHNMEILDLLLPATGGSVSAIRDYGSSRTLGRAYSKLPSLAGGSTSKAAALLSKAVANTLVPGQKFSRNGLNNIYFADVLHQSGNDDQAKALLTAFIKADPKSIDPTSIPEVRQAQQEAKDDMGGW